MALDTLPIYESRSAAKYDGTNSADFSAEIGDFTVDTVTPAGLTFTSGGTQYTVAPGGYIAWYQGVVTEVFQNEQDFHDTYASINVDVLNHVHDLVLTTGPAKPAPTP